MRTFLVPFAALALAIGGCATAGQSAKAPPPGSAAPVEQAPPPKMGGNAPPLAMQCDADAARKLAMGKPGTDALLEQTRVAAGARTLRHLHPGQPMTMDFRGDRLNVEVDASDIVVRVSCG